jgi:hypothetical protein
MGRTENSTAWTATEIKGLAIAWGNLLEDGTYSGSQLKAKFYDFYKLALQAQLQDPNLSEEDKRIYKQKGGVQGMLNGRSPEGIYTRWKDTDMAFMTNVLSPFWAHFYSPGSPDGPTGTTLRDVLFAIKRMVWLHLRLKRLTEQTDRKNKAAAKAKAKQAADIVGRAASGAVVQSSEAQASEGTLLLGCLADSQEDPVLEPEDVAKPAENERETAIKRAGFSVAGLDDKIACGGLTPKDMSKAGATLSKLRELNITDVDYLFDGIEEIENFESSFKGMPPCWDTWVQFGPPAPEDKRLSFLEFTAASVRSGTRRTHDGAGSARKKSKPEQEEHNKQTDYAMLQIILGMHTKDHALLVGGKERMLQLGNFHVGNMPSACDEAQHESEVGGTSA